MMMIGPAIPQEIRDQRDQVIGPDPKSLESTAVGNEVKQAITAQDNRPSLMDQHLLYKEVTAETRKYKDFNLQDDFNQDLRENLLKRLKGIDNKFVRE